MHHEGPYLYFKFLHGTGQDDFSQRVGRFIVDDQMASVVASRMSNEASHLAEIFDRSMHPVDIPETRRVAAYVLDRLEAADKPQYDSLMASIGAASAHAA